MTKITIVKEKRSAQRLLWVMHLNEIRATFHELRQISNGSYRSLTARGHSKFDKEQKSDERGALHHKSVNTEFDCRGPFQRKRTQSLTETRHIAHECSHDNPFYRDIWKKRWSRKNLIRLCEEKCKYLLLFKEMTTSRWLVQARVFFTFEIKGFAWQNETLKKWTKILSFFSHWTEYLFSWDIWCNVCYP